MTAIRSDVDTRGGKPKFVFHHRSQMSSIMRFLLSSVGLVAPVCERSVRPRLCAIALMGLTAFSLLYELTIAVTKLVWESNLLSAGKIAGAVNLCQYSSKSLTTLLIIVTFWRKSSVISSIMDRTQFGKVSQRKSVKKVIRLTFATFFLYLAMIISFRLMRVIISTEEPYSTVLWPNINIVQEQILIFIVRNFTESIALLCSGYLAVLLHEYATGLAGQCRTLFLRKSENWSEKTSLFTYADVQNAFDTREQALAFAVVIEKELGPLLSVILLSDVVSLCSTFGDFLFFTDPAVYIHNVASILLYVVSMMGVSSGLISLSHEDEETLRVLKMLKSRLAHDSSRTKSLERSSSLRNWKGEDANGENGKVGKHELLRLLSALKSSCFGTRKAAPTLPIFGYVTSGTITNVAGLLFTFTCFMLDQYSRSEAVMQDILNLGLLNNSNSSTAE